MGRAGGSCSRIGACAFCRCFLTTTFGKGSMYAKTRVVGGITGKSLGTQAPLTLWSRICNP